MAAIAMFLTGCENPYMQQFRQEFGWNEARMVSDGWLKGRQIPVEATYCYETIAQSDCFVVARKGEEYRLINGANQGSLQSNF
jgi:hypothetical protein